MGRHTIFDHDEIISLRNSGMQPKQIAEKLGMKRNSVVCILSRNRRAQKPRRQRYSLRYKVIFDATKLFSSGAVFSSRDVHEGIKQGTWPDGIRFYDMKAKSVFVVLSEGGKQKLMEE